jgi:hypothetical protein
MNELGHYIELIVEPTVSDFKANPTSVRHTFLACVAIFHAIDRVARKPGNLRKTWSKKSIEFAIVDTIAHHFKHVTSGDDKIDRPGIPMSSVLGLSDTNENMDFHNIYFAIRDSVKFLREQADVIAQNGGGPGVRLREPR